MNRGLPILLAALLVSSCGEVAPTRRALERNPRQIVLITVDTLRADRLGCYGYEGETSPHIDTFAGKAVFYRQATSAAPWTVGSFASMFTGRAASEVTRDDHHPLNTEIPLLAELLKEAGFRTEAVISNPTLRRGIGFERGFDRYQELYIPTHDSMHPVSTGKSTKRTKVTAEAVTSAALAALERLQEQEFFLWILYLDPHTPYIRHDDSLYPDGWPSELDTPLGEPVSLMSVRSRIDHQAGTPLETHHGISPSSRVGERLKPLIDHLYDAEVRYVDHHLGRLLEGMRERGFLDRALTVLTADHGESIFDHEGFLGHGVLPYQASAHVPLIIRWPDRSPMVVDQPVVLTDLFPTILSFAGAEPSQAARSRGFSADRAPSRDSILVETTKWDHRALRRGPYKLVAWGGRHEGEISLFHLEQDPGELLDLAGEHPEVAKELKEDLEVAYRNLVTYDGTAELPPVDPAMSERLEALGYMD